MFIILDIITLHCKCASPATLCIWNFNRLGCEAGEEGDRFGFAHYMYQKSLQNCNSNMTQNFECSKEQTTITDFYETKIAVHRWDK